MLLSIIIPAYNEKDTILEVIKKVNETQISGADKEIIIVDDASNDGTRDLLDKLNARNIRVISHKKNMGKGAAVRTGFAHSKGDVVVIQDADLEYDPADFGRMIPYILDGSYKVVFGSRFMRKHKAKYHIYYLGNLFLSLLTRVIYLRKITDMETCYKMFTREVLEKIQKRKLRARGFDFEPEITAKIIKSGYKIKEIPIWYKCRNFNEGKKISWKDGVKAAYYLIKYRLLD